MLAASPGITYKRPPTKKRCSLVKGWGRKDETCFYHQSARRHESFGVGIRQKANMTFVADREEQVLGIIDIIVVLLERGKGDNSKGQYGSSIKEFGPSEEGGR